MNPITDPNLIKQLDAQAGSQSIQPVTDPDLIAKLEAQASGNAPAPMPNNNMPIGQRIGADVLGGLAQMGHGILNTPYNIANRINPQVAAYIPHQQDYDFGQMLGVNNPNILDKGISGIAQYAPYALGGEALGAAKLFSGMPTLASALLRGATAGGAFGTTQSQNPLTGALIGAPLGSAAELVPSAVSGLKSAFDAIRPAKFGNQIINDLSQGRTLDQNAQSLAGDIKNAFEERKEAGGQLYNPVFNSAGNSSIYSALRTSLNNNFKNTDQIVDYMHDATGKDFDDIDDVSDYLKNQFGYTFDNNRQLIKFFNSSPNASSTIPSSQYLNLGDDVIGSYDRKLTQLHNNFMDNPNLQNAHDLQSQLGSSIRNFEAMDAKKNLTAADRNIMQSQQEAKNALLSDINTFLSGKNPELANQYNNANLNWAQNVSPYLNNPRISAIAKGDITNPKNIGNLFSRPEEDTQKIAEDLGQSGANKILYSELGKPNVNTSPEQQLNAFNNLDNKGLSFYINKALQDQYESLSSKINARNMATLGTAKIIPKGVVNTAKNYVPSDDLQASIANFLNLGYRPSSQAIISNMAQENR